MFAGVDIAGSFRAQVVQTAGRPPNLDFETALADPLCSEHKLPAPIAVLENLREGPALRIEIERLVAEGILNEDSTTGELTFEREINCDLSGSTIKEKFIMKPSAYQYGVSLGNEPVLEVQEPYKVELTLERKNASINVTEYYKHFGIGTDLTAGIYGRTGTHERVGNFLSDRIESGILECEKVNANCQREVIYTFSWDHYRMYEIAVIETTHDEGGVPREILETSYARVRHPNRGDLEVDLGAENITSTTQSIYDKAGRLEQRERTIFDPEEHQTEVSVYNPNSGQLIESTSTRNGIITARNHDVVNDELGTMEALSYQYYPDVGVAVWFRDRSKFDEDGSLIYESSEVSTLPNAVPEAQESRPLDHPDPSATKAVYLPKGKVYEVESGGSRPKYILLQGFSMSYGTSNLFENLAKIPFPEEWEAVRIDSINSVWNQEGCGLLYTINISNPSGMESENYELLSVHHSPARVCSGSFVHAP